MIPEKIGRYEIKSELGRGGMATVYRGYDPRSEREVAIKVLPRELLHADPQFRLRFEREAKIIAQLEHPSIVPVYDVGEEDDQPYFVMRYMPGGDLSTRIKKRPYTVEEAIRILEQIAPGLDQAHSKGIVHRDLKPSNILFDNADVPYISDFGIAKLSQGQGTNVTGSAIIGTPAYMAPEQAQGDRVDGRADIYAIGTILYEMLSGRQPYEADTPMAVVVKHITEPVPHILDVNPDLPSFVEAVIQKALAKNRNERFNSAKELLEALRSMGQSATLQLSSTQLPGSGSVKTMPASTAGVAAVPPSTRKPFNVMVVIVPVVLVAAGLGAYLIFGGNKNNAVSASPTAPAVVVAATGTTAPLATDTPVPATSVPALATETATNVPPTETATQTAPKIPAFGGADKIALVAKNEVWVMNVDGSDPKPFTNDGATKTDLQWVPGTNNLIFISGKNVKMINTDTGRVDIIASYPSAVSLDAFRISPDGKQVGIALSREVYIVPFDLARLATAHTKSDLVALNGCLYNKPKSLSDVSLKEFRWSVDSKLAAWLFVGVVDGLQGDLVRVMDNISSCDPAKLNKINEFPAQFFTPDGYGTNHSLPDFDWDGAALFVFNTSRRNNGWGELYTYNYDLHKANKINPIGGRCCYRDARFSPDSTYLLFGFQDQNLGSTAPIKMYYVSIGEFGTGATLSPLPLPDDFFKSTDAPQPALNNAKP